MKSGILAVPLYSIPIKTFYLIKPFNIKSVIYNDIISSLILILNISLIINGGGYGLVGIYYYLWGKYLILSLIILSINIVYNNKVFNGW